MRSPLLLELEFTRAEEASDPYSFRFATQSYLLRRAGGGFESASLAWNDALLADLAAVHSPGRTPELLQRIGELLRRFVAQLGWAEQEQKIVAALREERRIMLTIRSAAAELYALPWELLTLKASGQHLGELPALLIRYEWPETTTLPENAASRIDGGRILLAWSAAGGSVPATEHAAAIRDACRDGFQAFDPAADVLAHASLGKLAAALAAAKSSGQPISVLHLLCHGGQAGPTGGTFGLVLDDEEAVKGSTIVDAGRLRQILGPHADMVRLVVLSACDSGNSGALGNQLGSIAQTLHRAGMAAVVASRYPLSVAGSSALTEVLYRELLTRPASLETALLAARSRLFVLAKSSDWASVQLYARAADGEDSRPIVMRPFRGLLSFQPEHRRFFFGRNREIQEIVGDLSALISAGKPRLLVVAGASGTGKSSVVLAGVGTESETAAGMQFRMSRMRPGSAPIAALDSVLQAASSGADSVQPLLVVDQFEEIFTHVADAATRQNFAQRLWTLASGKLCIILTVRVDFIGRCGELNLEGGSSGLSLDSIAYDETHRVFLARLGPAELRQAIEEPARLIGLHFDEGLVSRILSDVGSEPGALPLLEDTLDLLWQRRSGRTLLQSAYDEIGGVTGALRGRADALIDKLSADEQRLARRLLVRLVSIGDGGPSELGTRRRLPLGKLRPAAATAATDAATFERVLAQLTDARLLVCESDGPEQMVEVAHEALIRGWQRLRDWVREDHKLLAELEKVEQWAEQCEKFKTVLTGQQLGYANEVARDHKSELSQRARDILAESQTQQARRQRNGQLQLVGVSIFALLLAGLAGAALSFSQKAVRAQASAERSQKTIHKQLTENFVEQGRQYLVEHRDPLRALIYLNRALKEDSQNPSLRYLLSRALPGVEAQRLTLRGHQGAMLDVRFLHKDTQVMTIDGRGAIRIFDATTGALQRTFGGNSERENHVAVSVDGRYVLQRFGEKTVQLFDVESGRKIFEQQSPDGGAAILSPSGDRVLILGNETSSIWNPHTGTQEGKLATSAETALFSADSSRIVTFENMTAPAVWDARKGTQRFSLPHSDFFELVESAHLAERPGFDYGEPSIPVWSGIFSPDGKRLLTNSELGIRQWFADTGKMWWQGNEEQVTAMAYRPDSKRLAIGLLSGAVKIWTTIEGRSTVLSAHSAIVRSVVFSPDGKTLLAASDDQTVSIWKQEMEDPHEMETGYLYAGALIGHRGGVSGAAFSQDGKRAVTSSADGTAKIWDLSVFLARHVLPPVQAAKKVKPQPGQLNKAASSKSPNPIPAKPAEPPNSFVMSGSYSDEMGPVVTDKATGKQLWSGAQAWDLTPELRTPKEIDALIQCRVPLRLEQDRLVAVPTEPTRCP